MSALRLRGVSKSFGRRPVLRAVDLDVDVAERVAVMGPNGSGKTTLLRLATGLARPTAGSVVLHGAAPSEPTARRRLGTVLQDAPAYAELTPAEQLEMACALHGRPFRRQALGEAGLAAQMNQPAGGLSRGQRQRLALATALAVGQRILVLDEPLTALDEAGQDWALRALDAHEGAMLLAVHDDETARALGCRIHRLHKGRLQEDGS